MDYAATDDRDSLRLLICATAGLIRRYWLSTLMFTGFGSLLVWQLFLPGFIGIADTNDFARVAGRLCLAPSGAPTRFTFFQPEYTWSAHNFWASPFTSSETALGWLAIQLAGATYEGAHFDIRWLAALHVTLCLAGFAALLAALRECPKHVQAVVAAVPLLLMTDVCYTALLNSFYMDTVAFCSLVLMAGTAVLISSVEEPRTGQLALFFVAALLFATSKTQHAIWSFFPRSVSGRFRHSYQATPPPGGFARHVCAGLRLRRVHGAYGGPWI